MKPAKQSQRIVVIFSVTAVVALLIGAFLISGNLNSRDNLSGEDSSARDIDDVPQVKDYISENQFVLAFDQKEWSEEEVAVENVELKLTNIDTEGQLTLTTLPVTQATLADASKAYQDSLKNISAKFELIEAKTEEIDNTEVTKVTYKSSIYAQEESKGHEVYLYLHEGKLSIIEYVYPLGAEGDFSEFTNLIKTIKF